MSKEFNYKEWIDKCYNGKLNQEIDNVSRESALFLFERLLDKAIRDKENVKIISNQLSSSFYKRLIGKVQKVIDGGNKVEIIVEREVEKNNDFYDKFKHLVSIGSANFAGLPNFIVIGEQAYRYETSKDSRKALANFNDPKMGQFIGDLFTSIKAKINES